jgi:hypothetical protein
MAFLPSSRLCRLDSFLASFFRPQYAPDPFFAPACSVFLDFDAILTPPFYAANVLVFLKASQKLEVHEKLLLDYSMLGLTPVPAFEK